MRDEPTGVPEFEYGEYVQEVLRRWTACRAEREVLRSIVRRYDDGWDPTRISSDGGKTWRVSHWSSEDHADEPVSDVEAAAIQAALDDA